VGVGPENRKLFRTVDMFSILIRLVVTHVCNLSKLYLYLLYKKYNRIKLIKNNKITGESYPCSYEYWSLAEC
jgi:hypothetical protein